MADFRCVAVQESSFRGSRQCSVACSANEARGIHVLFHIRNEKLLRHFTDVEWKKVVICISRQLPFYYFAVFSFCCSLQGAHNQRLQAPKHNHAAVSAASSSALTVIAFPHL
jgi:hypothetical protein